MKEDTKMTILLWCKILIGSLQRNLAAISAGDRRCGRPVENIMNFEDIFLVNCLLDPFCGRSWSSARGSVRKFSISCPSCGEACEAWGVHHFKSGSVFLSFPHILFFETSWRLKDKLKKLCLDLSYY